MGTKVIKVSCSASPKTLWFHLPFEIDSGSVHPTLHAGSNTQLVETYDTGVNPLAELENVTGVRIIGRVLEVLGADMVAVGPKSFGLTLNDPGDWEQTFPQVVTAIRQERGCKDAKFEVYVTDKSVAPWHESLLEQFS